MRTYTFNECYELLNVDPKTFRGWLKEAGIDPDHQISRADRRIRFLTEEQLNKLAQDHGRLLRPSSPDEEEAISPGAFKLLMDRVARAEEEIARQQPRLEEARRYLEDHLTKLAEEFNQYRITVNEQRTEMEVAHADQVHSLKEQLQALEQKVDQMREVLTERFNQIRTEHQADLDNTRRLWEHLDTHSAEEAATLGKLETSLAGMQALQDDMQLQISTLEKASEPIWLKLTELETSASSSKTELDELKSRLEKEELRLMDLSRLVQEELRLSQLPQKKIPSRPKQTRHRAEAE